MVSVIIPTYNRAEKLKRCLESLVLQTVQDFEIIICDDGSTDNTKSIVNEYSESLNLIYDYDSNFGGPARPRNRGLQLAKGEFIAFLDSDDWWYPNKLKVSLKYLNHYDVVYHDLNSYVDEREPKGVVKGRFLHGNIMKELIINSNAIPNSSVILKRAIVEQVGNFSEDQSLVAVEDADYWIRSAKVTNKFKYIPEILGAYWVGENISHSHKQVIQQTFLLEKYYDQLTPKEQVLAKRTLAFNSARIYHSLAMFTEASTNYEMSLSLSNIYINFKALIGIGACKMNLIL